MMKKALIFAVYYRPPELMSAETIPVWIAVSLGMTHTTAVKYESVTPQIYSLLYLQYVYRLRHLPKNVSPRA